MPIKLSDLKNNSSQIRLRFGELGDINVTVYPHRFTQKLSSQWDDAFAEQDADGMADALGQLVTEWDLLDDDGNPLPINGRSIEDVGIGVFGMIFREIGEKIDPNAKSRKRNGR